MKSEEFVVEVSILMGVYNDADTVDTAIASIFNQTYQNLELIVCDDGSTDGSSAVLEACQRKYGERLVLLSNKTNCGLAVTLNRCFSVAKGLYIGRMDADDRSSPERIGRQVEFLQAHNEISFVGCCAYKFDGDGVYDTVIYPPYPNKRDLLWGSCFLHPTVMMRRSALETVHGYCEQKSCLRCEDYDLWLRFYSMGFRGANLQEKLFYYYEGSKNLAKRKYRYRVTETIVRVKGFYANHMLVRGLPYVIKPLAVGLLPAKLLLALKNRNK
ncbi:MAG TPA: glycosyltransferase [Caproicibacter sp.]|nr:glycosyltransferase [Caproicibacter sp.]